MWVRGKVGEWFERQRVREIDGDEAEKTKRLHWFNFGLHGGGDEASMRSGWFT